MEISSGEAVILRIEVEFIDQVLDRSLSRLAYLIEGCCSVSREGSSAKRGPLRGAPPRIPRLELCHRTILWRLPVGYSGFLFRIYLLRNTLFVRAEDGTHYCISSDRIQRALALAKLHGAPMPIHGSCEVRQFPYDMIASRLCRKGNRINNKGRSFTLSRGLPHAAYPHAVTM
jgi:hypothetical protein